MNHFEQLLYTTLRIEVLGEGSNAMSIGTGFLLAKPIDSIREKVYLISSRHVLENAKGLVINLTMSASGVPDHGNVYRMLIDDVGGCVTGHPNPNIDVAALEVTGLIECAPNRFYMKWFDYGMLSDFSESELSIAENVHFIGYPDNRFDSANNLPLMRTGMIASNPKLNSNGEPVFIIDAQVFPGSSGSPVVIDLTYENFRNGNIVIGGERKLKLLGIVAATMIRNNRLQSLQTSTIDFATQEVIGLGIVYKASAIKEVIDSI